MWELKEEYHRGTFIITSYEPVYFTLGKFSTNTNKFPSSEERNNFLSEPVDLDVVEAKFQLSLKTKVFYKALWGRPMFGQRFHNGPIGNYTTKNFPDLLGKPTTSQK